MQLIKQLGTRLCLTTPITCCYDTLAPCMPCIVVCRDHGSRRSPTIRHRRSS